MCWRKKVALYAEIAYKVNAQALQQGLNTAKEGAEWVGGVLQGDFKEDQTVAQIITNAVLSSIPFVGWVADGRDVIANIIKLTDEKNRKDKFIWLALVATLIGIIPGVGDAIKAVVKIVIQKGVDTLKPILRLLEKLGLGNRIKLLKEIEWGKINKGVLAKFNEIMDDIIVEIEKLLHKLPSGMKDTRLQISDFLKSLKAIKQEGQIQVQKAVYEIRDRLNELIRKYEANPEFSTAKPNAINFRRLMRERLTKGATDADEVAQIESHNLNYASKKGENSNKGIDQFVNEKAYKELLRKDGLNELADDDWFFKGQYENFSDISPQRVLPNKGNDGYLYRVIDQHPTQGTKPQGSYWSFNPPRGTEDQWRAGSAVKRQWNEDGQYVKMKIPDEGLAAMTGTASRQKLGAGYSIAGGEQQLYIPKKTIDKQFEEQGKNITTHNSPWNTDGKNTVSVSGGDVWENGE